MIKRVFAVLFSVLLVISCFGGCMQSDDNSGKKLKIVATMFPQYDFCRQICGDTADLTLLLPPGVESHSYDPTPSDIMTIINCDIFIYTGPQMESWVETILDGVGEDVKVVDLSQCVELSCSHEDHEHEDHEHAHHHDYDPHIWTSPVNAINMTQMITDSLCEISPRNAEFYRDNCDKYCAELSKLDSDLKAVSESAKRDTLVFGGRFAFGYLTEEYSFKWQAAYDSCSHESEPSVGKVAQLIDYVMDNDIPVVYYEELTDPTVARTIAKESGAELLLLHSCHNLSKYEFDSGATYISLMQVNVENLRKGLC